MEVKTISVAMATYQGERFIREQIDSILTQLGEGDELIISDDGSRDRTRSIIQDYQRTDSRVILVDGPCQGIVKNFENAIRHAHNERIFLADQDDVWAPDKVKTVMACFEQTDAVLVMHDACVVDEQLKEVEPSFFRLRRSRTGLVNNLIKNSYIGCCMAFNAQLVPDILPFPQKIPMHDQWIGLMAERVGRVELLDKPLLQYRRHGTNQSSMDHGSLRQMLTNRVRMIRALLRKKAR